MEVDKENMSTYELMELCEKEIYQELAKHGFGDESIGKRDKLLDQAKTIANIRSMYDSNENSRLNNNARNDVEEMKALTEQEMVKVKRTENRINGIKLGGGAIFLTILYMLSYNMDGLSRQDNKLGKLLSDIANVIYFKK